MEAQEGAAPEAVRLRIEGAEAVELLDYEAALRVTTALGELDLPLIGAKDAPVAPKPPQIRTVSPEAHEVTTPLAVVPAAGATRAALTDSPSGLRYATFLGGSNRDGGTGIAVDGAGCAYVTGRTSSSDFPAAQGPGYDTSFNGDYYGDAYVVKLNPSGTPTCRCGAGCAM